MSTERKMCITPEKKRENLEKVMSDRFSGLKESINRDKRNKEKLKNEKLKNEKLKNEKKKIRSNNHFYRENPIKIKSTKIDLSEESFPTLSKDVETPLVSLNENYLEKTKKIKEEKEKKNIKKVPQGWIILHKGTVTKNLILTEASQKNPYYNPGLSRKIIENREIYREELNELLGDISPYWDMSWLYDEIISYEFESEIESDEEEYVEDW